MSNGNAPVAIFNANSNPIQVSVNTGAPITINGTGPNQNWNPQQPSSNPLSYSNGYPQANVLGSFAPNQVVVIVNGVPVSQPLQISIPQSAPVFSLQLYIFFAYSTVSWTLLSSGQAIASGAAVSNASMMRAVPKKALSKSKPSKSSKSKPKSKK